tara:strand:+ start:15 stop:248 length:234 start_codon:yes stop_codon:yes gene_type:complete
MNIKQYDIETICKDFTHLELDKCVQYHEGQISSKPQKYSLFLLCLERAKIGIEEQNTPSYMPDCLLGVIARENIKKR